MSHHHENQTNSNQTASRPRRGGRPRNPDRGLPDEQSICDIAACYLAEQRRHWHDVAGVEIPAAGEETISEYVEDFRARFRGASNPAGVEIAVPAKTSLAAAYLRFSSDNSNPRSLAQQLILILALAAGTGISSRSNSCSPIRPRRPQSRRGRPTSAPKPRSYKTSGSQCSIATTSAAPTETRSKC